MVLSRRDLIRESALSLGRAAGGYLLGLNRPSMKLLERASTPNVETLRGQASPSGFTIGSAVKSSELKSQPTFRSLVSQQANILVAEFEMKWDAMRPTPNSFNFVAADYLLAFAKANGQKFRGHNLCWYQALPSWFSGYATSSNARSLLSTHIRTVVGRYAGQMHSWDVVNEPLNLGDGRPDGLRVSPWLKLAGSDYIDYAFRVARTADPNALLTLNEDGIELDTPGCVTKRGYLLQLVKGMKARGVPIDAVGIESHLVAGSASFGQGLVTFVRELAALNIQVFITEMDVSDVNISGSVADRDAVVAATYAGYLGLLLPEPNVKAMLTWECRDPDSWLQSYSPRADGSPLRPLPFDANYLPKPAFTAIYQGLAALSATA